LVSVDFSGSLPHSPHHDCWPERLSGIAYGADYNPEQWPRETWAEDVRLMREAGVTVVTVGVFSWALLEPAQGCFELDWLADAIDLLHESGIAVDLATATASPPPWLTAAHPEVLPRTADGTVLSPGGRQAWCPSSPVFRERALALVTALAERFHDHPALAMWHVSNELGGHNAHCYCDVSAAAVSRLAVRALRRRGAAQRGVGHRVLEPALQLLRRGPPAAHGADLRQPHPAAGLPALQLGPRCWSASPPSATSCTSSHPAYRSPPTSW
jgi:hypothetical protein